MHASLKITFSVISICLLFAVGGYAEESKVPDCLDFGGAAASSALVNGDVAVRLKVDAIQGARVVGETLFVFRDGVVKFPIEFVNRDTLSYNGSNGFKVRSLDGATWGHATTNGGNYKFAPAVSGLWLDTTGFYPKAEFGGLYKFNCFGGDGGGDDSVVWGGAANDGSQLAIRPHDSDIFFYLIIHPKLTDIGKHICIDSTTHCPPGCSSWRWPSFNFLPAFTAYPTWDGPYCFVLGGCCQGVTGNYDCDPEDLCDIADISAFIDRYTTLALPCCPKEANMDGSPDGQSDISDLTALIDHLYISFAALPTCQ